MPAGCGHGFQTLSDDAELLYHMSVEYVPEAARGVRWDDPTLAIAWPLPEPILSERDRALPAFARTGRQRRPPRRREPTSRNAKRARP